MSNLDGGFYALAATGAAGSQSNYWGEVVSVTKSGSSYLTGKYWPASNPGLTSFYASNVSPTFAASGPTVTLADCNTDVVCAHAASPTYGVNCPLTFNHVLARVGTITLNTKSGYELSAVTATLKNGVTGGTYNLRTGAWSSLGAGSDKSTGAFSGNTSAQTSDNDIWLIPGTYTISLSYTLTKGDYVYDAVNKTGSVTILAGNTNNITTTAVGVDATEIVFSVSVTPWSLNETDMDFYVAVNPHPFNLDGKTVYFTTSNLMYDGTKAAGQRWHLMEHPWSTLESMGKVESLTESSSISLFGWATSGYNGKNPWMTTATNSDYGPALDSGDWTDDSSEWDWGRHNDIYDYIGEMIPQVRTLTYAEFEDALISGPGYRQAIVNDIHGMILFSSDYEHPDGISPIGAPNSGYGPSALIFSSDDWRKMSKAGAVFLPTTGSRMPDGHYMGTFGYVGGTTTAGSYATSSIYSSSDCYNLNFGGNMIASSEHTSKSGGLAVRLIQDPSL